MVKQLTPSNYELIPVMETSGVRFYTSLDYGSYVAPHWHDAVEIVLLQEGDLTFSIEDRTLYLKPGQCVLVNPNVIHATRCFANRAIVFQVPVGPFIKFVPDLHPLVFSLTDPAPNPSGQQAVDKLKAYMEEMQGYRDEQPQGWEFLFNSVLFRLLYHLCHFFGSSMAEGNLTRTEHDLQRLTTVLTYIEKHYTATISLEEISNIACLNPKYFCKLFKKQMGVTFLEYQNKYRLSKVYSDLLSTEEPVTLLLERHGFRNYKTFRRIFSEQFGMTPTEARKKHQDMRSGIVEAGVQ